MVTSRVLLGMSCMLLLGAVTHESMAAETGIDLMQQYPTTLTTGDTDGKNARPWKITEKDIYHLSKFSLTLPDGVSMLSRALPDSVSISIEEADLGIGHCADGAVWAAVIPRSKGTLESFCAKQPEAISSLWLRFHPSKLAILFPPQTVVGPGNTQLLPRMRELAFGRMDTSYQAGRRAMIPWPKNMTVLPETVEGELRFFMVDTEWNKTEYVDSFNHPFRDVQKKLKQ